VSEAAPGCGWPPAVTIVPLIAKTRGGPAGVPCVSATAADTGSGTLDCAAACVATDQDAHTTKTTRREGVMRMAFAGAVPKDAAVCATPVRAESRDTFNSSYRA